MSGTNEKSGPDFRMDQNTDSMSVDERIAYFQKLLAEFEDKEQAIDELERRHSRSRSIPEE